MGPPIGRDAERLSQRHLATRLFGGAGPSPPPQDSKHPWRRGCHHIKSIDFFEDAIAKDVEELPDESPTALVKVQSRHPATGSHLSNDVSAHEWQDATPFRPINLVAERAGRLATHVIDGFVARGSEWRIVFFFFSGGAETGLRRMGIYIMIAYGMIHTAMSSSNNYQYVNVVCVVILIADSRWEAR